MAETSNTLAAPRAGWAWWMIPLVAVVASYASTFTAGFAWDDYDLIVQSPLLSGKAGILTHFSQPFWSNALISARSFYRPLVTLSYALDQSVWGSFPGGYHLTNLLLHLVATLGLALLCRRAGAGRPVAVLLATVFAMFPRLTENVAWIAGRTDILAAIFVFAALGLFDPAPGRGWRRVGAGVALLAALLSKEVALGGAVALLVWAALATKGRPRRLVPVLLPVGVALAVYTWLRLRAMGGAAADPLAPPRAPKEILLSFGEALARYAGMFLDALRPRLQIGDRYHPSWPLALLGYGLLGVGVAWVWRARARISTYGWVALALGGTALFLVSHVIRLDANVSAADRFLYLPVAAVMLGLAGGVERRWRTHRRILMPGLFLLIGVFTVTTALRARLWGNELALWRFEEKVAPPTIALPRMELAVALQNRGRYAEALPILAKIPSAFQYLAVLNQATCLDKLGRRPEAVAKLEGVLATEQKESLRSRARINLMLLYARARNFPKARALGADIATRHPDRADILALVGKVAAAEREWSTFPPERLDEPLPLRATRATWFAKLGALPEAQARFARIALDPDANTEQALQALGFLVFEGQGELARATLSALSARSDLARELPALRAALANRFDEGD